jgi:hypothetical protein
MLKLNTKEKQIQNRLKNNTIFLDRLEFFTNNRNNRKPENTKLWLIKLSKIIKCMNRKIKRILSLINLIMKMKEK